MSEVKKEKSKLERIKEALGKHERKEGDFAHASYSIGAIKAIVDLPEREPVRQRRLNG
nr:MAG: hypothetical protein OI719_00260 [Candidatus Methanoperedens sp.]